MPQPASSPMHAQPLHQHSHQPSPHHPASAVPLTVGKGGGAERVARIRSAAHAIEPCVRSAWRASVMRAEQHQPCGALSWRRRRTHGCRKQLRVSGCHKQLRRSQLVRAVSPVSTTRIGCGGQARAAAGGPAPCSVRAHVWQPLQQAAPAATHVCSRTHDLWMRERLIERCAMAAAPTRGLRRGAGIPQRVRWTRALAQRGERG